MTTPNLPENNIQNNKNSKLEVEISSPSHLSSSQKSNSNNKNPAKKRKSATPRIKKNANNKKTKAMFDSLNRFKELLYLLKSHEIVRCLTPEKLRAILEDMGPTYVKIGQIMSMRSDILPKEYCNELSLLRSNVKPMPFSEVIAVIEQETGLPYKDIFSSIEKNPVGSASIAQVHKAFLKKDNKPVVVKVQRLNIWETMHKDIVLMKKAVKFLNLWSELDNQPIDFNEVISEMWQVAQQEMNFLLEAQNMLDFEKLNKNIEYIKCPKVYTDISTKKMLIMEFIDGIPIDQKDKLLSLGYDLNEIGIKLAENYSKQILDDAFFHADPHPGNIWIKDGKIVWLDFGMVGRLSDRDKKLFSNAIVAMAEKDVNELKTIILTIGITKGRINHSRLYADIDDLVNKYADLDLKDINMGIFIDELLDAAKNNNIAMPSNMTMLARGGITIEGVISSCSPNTSCVQILARHLSSNIIDNIDIKKTSKQFIKDLNSLFTKGITLPSKLVDLLNMTAKGHTKVNLEITGSEEPLEHIDAMVNRIIICIIIASLLISSSTICTTNMTPTFMDIPAIGALGYIAAVILGAGLLLSIWRKKRKKRKIKK